MQEQIYALLKNLDERLQRLERYLPDKAIRQDQMMFQVGLRQLDCVIKEKEDG